MTLPHRPDPDDARYCLACRRSIAGNFTDGTYGPTASGLDPCGWHVPEDFAEPPSVPAKPFVNPGTAPGVCDTVTCADTVKP